MFYLPDRGVLSGCCLSIRDKTSLGKFKESDLKENFPPEILQKRILLKKKKKLCRGLGRGVLRIQKSEEEKKGNYFQLLVDTSTQGPGVAAFI